MSKLIEISNDDDSKKLFEAVRGDDTRELMDLVLSTHCDPRCVRNEQQQTLLHFACQLNRSNVVDMVRTLVEIYHCNPLLQDQNLLTAYHYACLSGNLVLLSYLLRSRNYHYVSDFIPPSLLSMHETTSKKITSEMLITASKSGNVAMTRFTFMLLRPDGRALDVLKSKLNLFNDALNVICKLLKYEKNLRFFNSEHGTALYEACCTGSLHALKVYLEELNLETYQFCDVQLKSREDRHRQLYASLLKAAYRLNNCEIAYYLTAVRGFSPVQSKFYHHDSALCIHQEKCIEESVRIDREDAYSALHTAVRCGNIEAVLRFSLTYKSLQESRVIDNVTLLHSACISGKPKVVKTVIEEFDCDTNACDSNGNTPLHVASEWGYFEICLLLLEQNGCQINATNVQGYTPLMVAIKHNRFNIFHSLLERGADVSKKTIDTNETCLHLASCNESSKFVSALLSYTMHEALLLYLNASDSYGDTPLFNACRTGSIELVECFVAIPNCERQYANPITNDTPAHIACRLNRIDILKAIVFRGLDVLLKCHQLNHLNKSLLHIACENDAEGIVNYLIDKAICNLNNKDSKGRTPLHIATWRGNTAIVKKLLMSHVCNINDVDKDENTVFHYICTRDLVDTELVETLSEYVTPDMSLLNKENIQGYTPLYYLCENGGVQVLQCLLQHFGNEKINTTICYTNECNTNTPLHLAFKEGNIAMIAYLLKNDQLIEGLSKSLSVQNNNGDNVFHIAMEGDRFVHSNDGNQTLRTFTVAVIEAYLHSKLKVEGLVTCLCQRSSTGFTPIHVLIHKSLVTTHSIQILSYLFETDLISPNLREKIFSVTSSGGDTLVHLAVAKHSNEFEVVEYLVKLSFWNPTVSNDKGETPLHVACCNRDLQVSELLCMFGCNPHQLDKSGYSPLFQALKVRGELLSVLLSSGYWVPEQPVIQINSDHQEYGHYYKQIMIDSESTKAPTVFTLPLFHCALFMNANADILKEIAYVLVKCEHPNLCDSLGNTILHVCSMCRYQIDYDILKNIMALDDCDMNRQNNDNNTPLHIASSKNNVSMAKLLLESSKCKSQNMKNKDDHTPIYYASNRELINLLVINGADPKDVADTKRVKHLTDMFKAVKSKHPLNLTVTALVLGNSLAGKTTLLKSLTKACSWDQLGQTSVAQDEDKCERTAGIEISEYEVNKERTQRVLLYDFAGHPEFHSTHSVLLQNRLTFSGSSQDSPLLFIIVVDITASDKVKQLMYWTKFILNCQLSGNTGRKPEAIIIGSHVDMFSGSQNKIKDSLCQTMDKMSKYIVCLENPIFLDCRKPSEFEVQKMERLLIMSTKTLKSHVDLDNRCHLIFSYLYDHYPDKPVKFSELQGKLRKHKSDYNIDFYFTSSKLKDLLMSMHEMHHILLIGSTSESNDFWILTAKAQNLIFHKVQGLLFAGEDFDQRPSIESNVGVISSSEIKAIFPDFEYEMLQQFLVYSEFCKKIEDAQVLKLIQGNTGTDSKGKQEMKVTADHDSDIPDVPDIATKHSKCVDYFFFPGLVKKSKENSWKASDIYSYCSGWSLECTRDDFFNPLFLQVLLLRMTFQFATTTTQESVLRRKCNIWKNGIFWSAPGVEMLVEVTNQNQTVLVLVRCFKDTELEAVKLRSAVIKEVHKVRAKHSPATKVNEFIFCTPSLDESGSLTESIKKVALMDIATAIIRGVDYVQNECYEHQLINRDLLCFEPYTVINQKAMASFFDPDEATKVVPDNFMSEYYNESELDTEPELTKQFKELTRKLEHPVLHRNLRDLFDHYSIFHGRDPKNLN